MNGRARGVARAFPVGRKASTLVAGMAVSTGLSRAVHVLGWRDAVALGFTLVVLGVISATVVACVRPVRPIGYVCGGAMTGVGGLMIWGLVTVSPMVALVGGCATAVELVCVQAGRAREASQPRPRTALQPAARVMAPIPLEGEELEVTEAMTDQDLCWAWRSSFVALQRVTSHESRIRLAQFRRLLLDDLERRHPHGIDAWLRSGARAAGDPMRHLRR